MHASVHELLSLRDDVVVDEAVAAHVRDCEECGVELSRLRALTAELRALPGKWVAPDRWGRIETALALNVIDLAALEPPPVKSRKPGWGLPLAAAATVLVTVAAITWQGRRESTPEVEMARASETAPENLEGAAAAEAQITAQQALAERSRQLERVLAVLPEEPSVTRAGTALTLADLQDRIRWVDYRLALAEKAGTEPRQSEQLWQERVDLLNSLMAVRYAQTRTAF
jgi:hypothetical protein